MATPDGPPGASPLAPLNSDLAGVLGWFWQAPSPWAAALHAALVVGLGLGLRASLSNGPSPAPPAPPAGRSRILGLLLLGAACVALWNHERWVTAAGLARGVDWSAALQGLELRAGALVPEPTGMALAARAAQLVALPALLIAALASRDPLRRRARRLFAGSAALGLLSGLLVPQLGPGADGPLPAADLPLARLLGAEHSGAPALAPALAYGLLRLLPGLTLARLTAGATLAAVTWGGLAFAQFGPLGWLLGLNLSEFLVRTVAQGPRRPTRPKKSPAPTSA